MIGHMMAIILALILDKLIGDPKWLPHPVKGMGWLISKLEQRMNNGSNRILKGTIAAFIVVLIPFLLSLMIVVFLYEVHLIAGIIAEAVLLFTTIAPKSLAVAAMDVYQPLKNGQMVKAREKLGWIVGRDTENLNEEEIVRGVVETVAENTSDGVTAPIFYAIIGGAPLAMAYRAINTLDSMVGHKNNRYLLFGRASAKWDDWVNLLPSRLTGICMLLSNLHISSISIDKVFPILFRDAKKHPSPNSGWGEAAMAVLLGVQLGGANYYQGNLSIRPKIGLRLRILHKEHILQSIYIMRRTVLLFTLLTLLGGVFYYYISQAWS
ncbi:adenosylcobinamide-phosphate synthase [Bacillus mesophilus]|uniref:Cobalamin biosynthesis protein CobD n=1 Tax=Bacillus mesophilus TaxID=1808955 RepID=A0A6M0Q8E6_9BACI|nr:adenosylcobinamide-phosphate synthase CbiB [Bacillus mesophilus]MBM7661185.1 adenosylcobinamide-phosphate synthase [Bacillus mesophilus]NEY71288.1 cobalamin biosynthesis protein CobD [Bacillus mesophilus]